MTSKIDEGDTIHYLVIGIGVVSVPKPKGPTGVLATRASGVGAIVSDQPGLKFGLGAISTSTVAVNKGAKDVRLDIQQGPMGKMILRAKKVEFTDEGGKR